MIAWQNWNYLRRGGQNQRWGLLSQFSVIFPIFQNNEYTGYLYDIMFIFDRCHRSSAAETPDKYECNWKCLTFTFAKLKFLAMDKLANGDLVTPTPRLLMPWLLASPDHQQPWYRVCNDKQVLVSSSRIFHFNLNGITAIHAQTCHSIHFKTAFRLVQQRRNICICSGKKVYFLHAKPWILIGKKSLFTVGIH